MSKKGGRQKMSLQDLLEQEKQQKMAEQARLQQEAQAAAAKKKSSTPATTTTTSSKDKKNKKNQQAQEAHTPKPNTPVSSKKDQQQGTYYKLPEECAKMLPIFKQVLQQHYEQLDVPILNYLTSVIHAQNNAQTKVKEDQVVQILNMFFLQCIVPVPSHDQAQAFTSQLLTQLKEQQMLKEIADQQAQVKLLEEAVNLGKSFEDQLKQQQRMIKGLAPNAVDDAAASLNFNDKLDWEEKVQKALDDKRKKKDDKEKAAKLKEYEDFLKQRGITNAKGVVKIHSAESSLPGSRDINLMSVTITVGSRDLLQNANLFLTQGKRYGLIGRNGVGKTTLLRHICEKELEGIPTYLQILHIEQEVSGDNVTALESVLKTDVERERLLQEEQRLLTTTEEGGSEKLNEIYERMEEIDAHTAEARAANLLTGLSFTPEMQQMSTKHFSGGWRMRLALARALFVEPDVLLLDEPTNHLDLHAVLWLENFLQKWEKTLVVVSHSRSFLNAVATDVIQFQDKQLKVFKGNYDTYEKTRLDMLTMQQKAHEAQEKQRQHHQQFIDRFRYKAATARMVQSRLKMLEKMEFIPAVVEDPAFSFNIPNPEDVAPPFLQAIDVTFGYSNEKILFKDLNFHLDNESRIALVGANGSGKSTFMKILTGDLKPMKGYMNLNKKIRIARFSQHHMDQLNPQMTPLEYMQDKFPKSEEQALRSHLGSMGLSGTLALQNIYTLSGGQKSRVVFAEITFKKPHLLLLDEPTNHLDLDTIDALIQAINQFSGGVLIISHDEHLITCVCDELWVCGGGRIAKFADGDFQAYKKSVLNEVKF